LLKRDLELGRVRKVTSKRKKTQLVERLLVKGELNQTVSRRGREGGKGAGDRSHYQFAESLKVIYIKARGGCGNRMRGKAFLAIGPPST